MLKRYKISDFAMTKEYEMSPPRRRIEGGAGRSTDGKLK
jgi:hypothetical protein